MSRHCRTCGKFIFCLNTQNLFTQPDNVMLHQIEALTGLCLLLHSDMPMHICGPCEVALREAIAFRERIIKTQNLLQSSESVAEALKLIDLEETIVREESDVVDYDQAESVIFTDFTEEEITTDEAFIQQTDTESEQRTQHHLITSTEKAEVYESVQSIEEIPLSEPCERNDQNQAEEPSSLQFGIELAKDSSTNGVLLKKKEQGSTIYASVNFADNSKQLPRTNWSRLTEEEIVQLKRERRRRDCICEQCGRHFSCPSNFKVHLLRHTGIKNFSCSKCPQKFYTAHLLRRHEMLHVCSRPYPCQYCGQRFSHYNGRIQHERNRHTHFKPYKCTECDKEFAVSTKLKSHMLTHTGVRAFHCEICRQSFIRKPHLAAHLRTKGHKQNVEKETEHRTQVENSSIKMVT